jgi:hypothetical protein
LPSTVRARTTLLGATADHFERAGDLARAAEYHARAVEHAGRGACARRRRWSTRRVALALVEGDPGAGARALQWRVRAVRERTFDLLGRRAEHGADLDRSTRSPARGRRPAPRRRAEAASYYAMRIGDSRAQERTARAAMALAERCGAVEIACARRTCWRTALSDLGQVDEGRALATSGIAEARAHGLRRVEGAFSIRCR